jgi:glycosyltransferase involved in cell wall biosynthesis
LKKSSFQSLENKKIAIVHDALVVTAGSEKVALHLSNLFPNAPIFTSAYLPEKTFPEFKSKNVKTLPLASLVKNEKQFKYLFPLWYAGFSHLDLKGYDIVISSANYLAKYINPPSSTVHVCYLHNPFRYLWKPDAYSDQSVPYNHAAMSFVRLMLPIFRQIDIRRTRKIKNLLTNSQNVANQIERIYGLKAEVIYPPINFEEYLFSKETDSYYLYAGRLISHKRVDLAIEACKRLKRPLVIAGDGLERSTLEKLGGENVRFMGRVSLEELKHLYSHCRALIFPSDEDFGIVPVEAQASGRPVIAYQSGGALETVVDNETGIFFSQQAVESLCEAMIRFEKMKFDPARIRSNAKRFDISVFNDRILDYLEKLC